MRQLAAMSDGSQRVDPKQANKLCEKSFPLLFLIWFLFKIPETRKKINIKIYIYKSSVTEDINCWDALVDHDGRSQTRSYWGVTTYVQNLWDDDDHKNKQEEMEFYKWHWQPPNNGKNQNQSTNHDTTPSPYHLSLFIKLHTRSYAIFS